MREIVALLLVLTLLGQSGPAWAQAASADSGARRALYGAGSVLGTVVYTPFKGLLCVMGGAASGLQFLASGARATRAMATASCGGTWVVTPDVLKGRAPLTFVAEIQ